MDIKKFVRKSFVVRGEQVVDESYLEDMARWTGGEIQTDAKGEKYVKVDVKHALNEKQTRAYVTDWVLQTKKGFKVYTDKAFNQNFEPAPEPRRITDVQVFNITNQVPPSVSDEDSARLRKAYVAAVTGRG